MRRQVGRWRIGVIVLCVIVIALVIAFAVVAAKMNDNAKEENAKEKITEAHSANECKSGLENINLNQPEVLTPFYDLTREEIHNIKDYLYKQRDLNLVHASNIAVNKSYIFTMEIRVPNKEQTLNYLDRNQRQPDREATVIIFRGDVADPQVEEYTVGPLPLPSYKKGPVAYPFKYRPFTLPEWVDMVEKVSKEVQDVAGDLLWESYKGKMLGHCEKQCLGFQLNIPESPGVTGNTQKRRYWLWMFQVVEYFSLHPLDFLVLTDVTGTDVNQYEIVKVIYAGETFDSLQALMIAYNHNSVTKLDVPFPIMDDNLYSSMHRRGKLFPEDEARRPLQIEPDGKRYSINGRHITYMNWQMHVRLSPICGPQLYDIRYNGERIIYEISIQEIGAYYSAHNPAHRFSDFADSFFMFGTQARTLVTGSDCPAHATYLSATYATESSEEASVIDRAFCVFEHNTETPLRRHNVRTSFEGNKFYEGMQDVVFIVRTIMTVVNYDYVVDFIFHQNGAIEVKIISTGYILTSFRMPEEEEYGFRLRDTIVGNMHHHMFHFKVDMDIKGTSNRYETLDIVPEAADNSKWATTANAQYHQTKLVKTQVRYEKDAALRYDFSAPKYLTFYNNESRSKHGIPRAYRLLMRGVSKQVRGIYFNMSLVLRKPVFGVSDQVRHKSGLPSHRR